MKVSVHSCGFLVSNAISLMEHQSVTDGRILGYLSADFDMRNRPVTQALYKESETWQQIKGNLSILGQVFKQRRPKENVQVFSIVSDRLLDDECT